MNFNMNFNMIDLFNLSYRSEYGVLINDDCLNVLKQLDDKMFDLIILDPPYVYFQDERIDRKETWSLKRDWKMLFYETNRLLKDDGVVFLFGLSSFYIDIAQYIKEFFDVYFEMIWIKPIPVGYFRAKFRPLPRHEQILALVKTNAEKTKITYNYMHIGENGKPYNIKRSGYDPYQKVYRRDSSSDGFRYPTTVILAENKPAMSEDEKTPHPTQKPISLISKLVLGWTNEYEYVLDPFLGSGTTAVVCEKLKRYFIGIEIDKEYYEIAKKRLETDKEIILNKHFKTIPLSNFIEV